MKSPPHGLGLGLGLGFHGSRLILRVLRGPAWASGPGGQSPSLTGHPRWTPRRSKLRLLPRIPDTNDHDSGLITSGTTGTPGPAHHTPQQLDDDTAEPRGGDGRHFDLPFVHTDFVFPVCVFLGGADSHPRPHPTPSTALYGYYHICCYPRASGAAISAGHRERKGAATVVGKSWRHF